MSRFSEAIEYVLENEGGYTNDKQDRGGCTNFGISLNTIVTMPEFGIKNCEDIKTLTREQAKKIYYMVWWKFEYILNQQVATKMFDIFVNLPPGSANRLYQRAANACGAQLKVDGIYGALTEAAINKLDPKAYLMELVDQLHSYYNKVVEARPEQAVFIRGWLQRADRLPK